MYLRGVEMGAREQDQIGAGEANYTGLHGFWIWRIARYMELARDQ